MNSSFLGGVTLCGFLYRCHRFGGACFLHLQSSAIFYWRAAKQTPIDKVTRCWRSWIRASWYNYENDQQDALYKLIYYSKSALHVSGDVFAHHQEHLTVFTVSGSVLVVSWMSLNGVSTHPRYQPAAAWVNTTRYCKYSQVLLMMGENIARNI